MLEIKAEGQFYIQEDLIPILLNFEFKVLPDVSDFLVPSQTNLIEQNCHFFLKKIITFDEKMLQLINF